MAFYNSSSLSMALKSQLGSISSLSSVCCVFFCLSPELCVRSEPKVALEASLSSLLPLQKQVKQWVPAVHRSYYLNSHHAMVKHPPAALFLVNLLLRGRMVDEGCRKLFLKLEVDEQLQD